MILERIRWNCTKSIRYFGTKVKGYGEDKDKEHGWCGLMFVGTIRRRKTSLGPLGMKI